MSFANPDREVLGSAAQWVAEGRRAALVTVCRTWGSSPRPVGSLLAMCSEGKAVGSVSGGCVEDDLVSRYRAGELAGPGADAKPGEYAPTRVDYGVDRVDAQRHGLPCGGRLELLVEPLSEASQLGALIERIDAGELVRRTLQLESGAVQLHTAEVTDEFACDSRQLAQVFGASWHLLLIGDNQLARYLAQMALMTGFRVTLCDPRASAFAQALPDNLGRSLSMPDDAVLELANHASSAVITLAHDPKVDDMALMVALESKAFYVGALGSHRSNEQRRERLAALGVPTSALSRLHAPVGLNIGSKTPPEIALSIMAEVVAVRSALRKRGGVAPTVASA